MLEATITRQEERSGRMARPRWDQASTLGALLRAAAQGLLQTFKGNTSISSFYRWGLQSARARSMGFHDLTGLRQLASLTYKLLEGCPRSDVEWRAVIEASARMNSWQIHEVVSDNLAIGLARTGGERDARRVHLLRTFNEEIADALRSRPLPQEAYVETFLSCAAGVPPWLISLSRMEYEQIVRCFAAEQGLALEDLVDSWLPVVLAVNIGACAAIPESFEIEPLRDFVRASLIRRYSGVNRLLTETILEPETLLDIGTQTILVLPTLGFYIDRFAILRGGQERLSIERWSESGRLESLLLRAARMVRTLNDLGSVIALGEVDVVSEIRGAARGLDCCAAAMNRGQLQIPLLSRINKDAHFGEFNVLLDALSPDLGTPAAEEALSSHFSYFQDQYRNDRLILSTEVDDLRRASGSEVYSQLIERFVGFHEHLYRHSYLSQMGEYAVVESACKG